MFGNASKPQYSKCGDFLEAGLNELKERPQVGASGLEWGGALHPVASVGLLCRVERAPFAPPRVVVVEHKKYRRTVRMGYS